MKEEEPIKSLQERLEAHPDYTGANVVMGFVDSGFFPHPDLTRPNNRIALYVDVTQEQPVVGDFLVPDVHAWHGTMTACCAAGNGYLSRGQYRGLASAAKVVLLKARHQTTGRIEGSAVADALRFPLKHPELGIRVLNCSLGVDTDDPAASDVEAAVEELFHAGVVVVAAAGNLEAEMPEPPASAPYAITVGGLDDQNTHRDDHHIRWPSSSGRPGGVPKPELLAPANRLPAPMVPGTLVTREAPHLFNLMRVLEEQENDITFRKGRPLDKTDPDEKSLSDMIQSLRRRMRYRKYIAPAYQHVDGTSFAAPIVASVVAQMLEANRRLTPADVREGLLKTCRPLEDVPPALQGVGEVRPRAAVEWALQRHARS